MTTNGVLQIVLFFGILAVLIKPLGVYMARVFAGERTFLDPVLRPVERLIYRICGVDPEREQHWTTYTVAMLLFNFAGLLLLYVLQRTQHLLPLNPQGLAGGAGRPRLEHRRELHQQHQLAELQRRDDDELPGADGRADLPQLRLCRHRHRARHRPGARLRAPHREDDRQLLGRPGALHAVDPAAALARPGAGARLAGRAAELPPVRACDDGRRRRADHPAGTGRVAGSDQAARHQRRRLLQRQLGASVREPDAALQPAWRCSRSSRSARR